MKSFVLKLSMKEHFGNISDLFSSYTAYKALNSQFPISK